MAETRSRLAHADSRLALALVAVTLGALAARLAFLGSRVAHWDEGRVAYWILDFMETGSWSYRPIIHGPFFHRVNPIVFDLIGVSDFSMRVVAALLGGLLPLGAWLFREHLRDSEVVALALLLAVNPILLYYSRFMRGDLPLAAFAVFALGFFVRTYDTRKPRYLYVGTAMLALAFTTKENVLIYLLTWLGAAALLFDHRLFRARDRNQEWTTVFKTYVRKVAKGLWRWKLPFVLALLEFFVIVVYFYAPRPDLWQAFGDPTQFPSVIGAATVGSWKEFFSTWASGTHQGHEYMPYFKHYVGVLGFAAAPLMLLAFGGFLKDRYSSAGPRDLVSFAFYWGFVSIFGYPLITDIQAPWATVHTVVPLAIPAAVGLALVYRWGKEAWADDDNVALGLTVVLLLLVTGQVAMTAVQTSYVDPSSEENKLVQYVQPPPELRGTLEQVERVSEADNETDLTFYGVYADDWHKRLPLPWYLSRYDTEIGKATNASELGENPPPIVIASGENNDEARTARETLDEHLVGYEKTERYMAIHSKTIVVYVDADRVRRESSANETG